MTTWKDVFKYITLNKKQIDVSPEEEPTPKVSELKINLTNGGMFSWCCSDMSKGYVYPWKEFIKWFTSREQSKFFIITYTNGMRLIRRDTILSYTINVIGQDKKV